MTPPASAGRAPGAGPRRAVRVGFSQLKQMSGSAQEDRRGAEVAFTSFEDFYLHPGGYPVAENLIRIGAFDSVGDRTNSSGVSPPPRPLERALASGRRQLELRLLRPERAALKHSGPWRTGCAPARTSGPRHLPPLALYEPTFSAWASPPAGNSADETRCRCGVSVYERARTPGCARSAHYVPTWRTPRSL